MQRCSLCQSDGVTQKIIIVNNSLGRLLPRLLFNLRAMKSDSLFKVHKLIPGIGKVTQTDHSPRHKTLKYVAFFTFFLLTSNPDL